ncbi:MAG: MFS transporter [Clostridiales Family XIII bacterium]|jgi:EmrB/QacA subfamily drug resistance transporter|nr:MFS transporter [Clostridiales Family XIII bacterium]
MEDHSEPTTGKSKNFAILITVLATSFVTTFSGSALNLSIPEISKEFGISAALIGWLVTSYILCSASLAVPFGRIADMGARRQVYLFGILIFALASGVTFFAQAFWHVLVLRILQGVGGAMIFSTNIAILVNAYPPQMRGKVIGFSVAATYVGLSMGPVVGGLLTHNSGWRSVFLVNFICGLIAFLVALFNVPKTSRAGNKSSKEKKDYDVPGMLMYFVSMLSTMYGLTILSSGILGWVLTIAGIGLLILFVRHEGRVEHPALAVRLFKNNPNFLLSNLAALLNYGATFATGYLVSIYLQTVQAYDAQQAGLILICQPAVMAVISPFAGRLSDKKSPFLLASIGMAFCAVSLFSYIFLGTDAPMFHIIINLVLVGIGFGLFSSPNTNVIMSSVPPKDSSIASSLLATMRTVGQVLSMAIITFIMNSHLGDKTLQNSPPELLVSAMKTSFIVFAAICAVGVLTSLQRKTNKEASKS